MDMLLYALLNKKIKTPDGEHSLLDESGKLNTSYIPRYLLSNIGYGGIVRVISGASGLKAFLTTLAQEKLGALSSVVTLSADMSGNYNYKKCEGLYFIVDATDYIEFDKLELRSGDWLVSTGSSWQKVDNTDAITGIKGEAEDEYHTSGQINITPEAIGVYTKEELEEIIPKVTNNIVEGSEQPITSDAAFKALEKKSDKESTDPVIIEWKNNPSSSERQKIIETLKIKTGKGNYNIFLKYGENYFPISLFSNNDGIITTTFNDIDNYLKYIITNTGTNGYSIEFDLWLINDDSAVKFWADTASTRFTIASTYLGIIREGTEGTSYTENIIISKNLKPTGTSNYHHVRIDFGVDGSDNIWIDGEELMHTGRTCDSYWNGKKQIIETEGAGVIIDNYIVTNNELVNFNDRDAKYFSELSNEFVTVYKNDIATLGLKIDTSYGEIKPNNNVLSSYNQYIEQIITNSLDKNSNMPITAAAVAEKFKDIDEDFSNKLDEKQDELQAGNGITIADGVISVSYPILDEVIF